MDTCPPDEPREVHEPTQRRRGRTLLVRSVVALGLVLVGWIGWRWWFAEPWSELERVASTFPVPANYELENQRREGDRPALCDIKIGCHRPSLNLNYLGDGPEDVCEAIDRALEMWESEGFSTTPQRDYLLSPHTRCTIDGQIQGHQVAVSGYSPDVLQPRRTIDERARIGVTIWP